MISSTIDANVAADAFFVRLAYEGSPIIIRNGSVLQHRDASPLRISYRGRSITIAPSTDSDAELMFTPNPYSPHTGGTFPENPIPLYDRGTLAQLHAMYSETTLDWIHRKILNHLSAQHLDRQNAMAQFPNVQELYRACGSIDFIIHGVIHYGLGLPVNNTPHREFADPQAALAPLPDAIGPLGVQPNSHQNLKHAGYLITPELVCPLSQGPTMSVMPNHVILFREPQDFLTNVAEFLDIAEEFPEYSYVQLRMERHTQGFLFGPGIPLSIFTEDNRAPMRDALQRYQHTLATELTAYLRDLSISVVLRDGQRWYQGNLFPLGCVRVGQGYYAAAHVPTFALRDFETGSYYQFPSVNIGIRVSVTADGYHCSHPVTLEPYVHPAVSWQPEFLNEICLGGPVRDNGKAQFAQRFGKMDNDPVVTYMALCEACLSLTDRYIPGAMFNRDSDGRELNLSHPIFEKFRITDPHG